METHDLARMMLDRLGDLATNYDIGEGAMDYLESIRQELRPIAWPEQEDAADPTAWGRVGVGIDQRPDGYYVYEEPFTEYRGGPYQSRYLAAVVAGDLAAALLDKEEE